MAEIISLNHSGTTYRRPEKGVHPEHLYEPYRSSLKRSPLNSLIEIPHTLTEITGPAFTEDDLKYSADLTLGHQGEPLGERIIVHGRVSDERGRPVPHTLVEIWQANAAGRYLHKKDQHNAPLDPNFTGVGQVFTDGEGRYRFVTILPGAYPWRNHYNAWRPVHIHFSLFGPAFATRLVTQMYFPGDPLLPFDPIYNGIRDEKARARLISAFDLDSSIEGWALAYRFDIILRGREETPFENFYK